MNSKQFIIKSCDLSIADVRNKINLCTVCGCREKWEYIKQAVNESDADVEKYKQIINKATGNREIHIVQCGHVWYGVK